MRFSLSSAVVAVAACFALVGAQDLQGIPTCALTCFAAAVPASGCTLTDTTCQCTTGKDKIAESVTSCVVQRCSAEDQGKIASAVTGICSRAGVTVSDLPTSTGAVASSTGSATGSKNGTSGVTGVKPSSGAPAEQTGNVAAQGGAVSLGALAIGMAAVFGL
ncbi:unnamed protein product [Periconia digitata]|uniref:CFEM domain-containing protein n=1 Tax=Periconia digitata TaxID=1303443 RepID=A0A9W4USZ2_9PLEO|nr:unnamed protein product [Periconia digitata]